MSDNGIPRLTSSQIEEIVDAAYQESDSKLLAMGLGQTNEWRKVDKEVGRLFAGLLSELAREAFPWACVYTAQEWAAMFNKFRKDASFASGAVTFLGSEGSAVKINKVIQVGGRKYRVVADAPVVDGKATLDVVALEPGVKGNMPDGAIATLASPIVGIASQGTVAVGGLTGGADEEDLREFQKRIVSGLRDYPGGGNDDDYTGWALEVPGVTRAWTDSHGNGDGTVVVRFMMDELYEDGIPCEQDEVRVLDYLRRHFDEGLGRYVGYPVNMEGKVYAWAPEPKPVNFLIEGLNPFTEAAKLAVKNQLKDLIRRVSFPGGYLAPSWCWEAISLARGERQHTLLEPETLVETRRGEIITFGEVQYASS